MINLPRSKSAAFLLTASILFIGIVWSSAHSFGQVPVTTIPLLQPESKIAIMNWRLAGPFSISPKEEMEADNSETLRPGVGRGHDFLKLFNLSEHSVDASTFSLIGKGSSRHDLDPAFDNRVVTADPRNNIMYYKEFSEVKPITTASFYLAAVINSPCDQDIGIVSGGSDNLQLWLNHKLLFVDRPNTWYWITNFQHVTGAKLRRGNNFVLIKVSHKERFRGIRLIVTLYPHAKALNLATDNQVNPIFTSSIVATGHRLQIHTDLFSHDHAAQLKITDIWNNSVDSAQLAGGRVLARSLQKLNKDEVYICNVRVGGETVVKPFYYGDVDDIYTILTNKYKDLGEVSAPIRVDVQSQLDRLRHLLLPESRTSARWDEKVVESIVELKHNLADLRQGENVFRRAPGTHLRGYQSSVDGQTQHYWLHIPEKALNTGKPLPLVIVVPFEVSKNRPFLESYFVADFDMTEAYKSLSDEYGFAVLQLWGRGNGAGGTAIGDSDVFDALDAVRRDYSIDLERIYLLGFCEGGRRALLLGEHYPRRFAAIATDHPVTISGSDNLWMKYTSPIEGVQSLVNIPIFINHDEAEPSPSFESSAIFARRGLSAGVNVTLVQAHGGGVVHGFSQNPTVDLRAMFKFFVGKHRVTAMRDPVASDTSLRRFGHGTGPIEDAFGGQILLVEGTHGTPGQNAVIHSLVEQFRDEWRQLYYVECPWKRDTDVTDSDIRNANLVVIGDQNTNSIVRKMASRLPVHITPNGIKVEGNYVQGSHLGYIFISRNPLNTKKYAVVIGMDQWSPVMGWKLYPSRDGKYDYMIFKLDEPIPSPVDVGYYTAEWSRFRWFLLHKYLAIVATSAIVMLLIGAAIKKARKPSLSPENVSHNELL
jgi:pimeloyl-ACP methyl ester carboxylesterase